MDARPQPEPLRDSGHSPSDIVLRPQPEQPREVEGREACFGERVAQVGDEQGVGPEHPNEAEGGIDSARLPVANWQPRVCAGRAERCSSRHGSHRAPQRRHRPARRGAISKKTRPSATVRSSARPGETVAPNTFAVVDPRFAHLMSPGNIGALEIRNRILMCPMGDCLAEDDGRVSDRQIAYYEARARGGAGLLLVGSVSVAYPAGSYGAQQTALSGDEFLPGLRRLTTRVHDHGARIAAQLVHDGQRSLLDIAQGRAVLCASPPARVTSDRLSRMVTAEESAAMTAPFRQPSSKIAAHIAEEGDLAWAIDAFAQATERAVRAGFDGVEVHAGHGYLIDDFLSPATNKRDDRWGGSVENRARLLCDVLRAARATVGADFPVWFRVNALEMFRAGGETFDDTLRVIDLAIEAGADAVHVSAYADPAVAVGITRSHTPHEPNALVGFAAAVKQRVLVPVITFGRIEPDDAERVVAEGSADFVAMGRKLLADPDLPQKLREGRIDDVRPCIYQYRCIGNIFLGDSVACVVNPATGRGDTAIAITDAPRRVLVIGGGPAGMEAARRFATLGHAVELWEAQERLGGRLASAARCDAPLDRLLGWLLHEVDRSGTVVELGVTVTPDRVLGGGFDEVVVATGASWTVPNVTGAQLPFVSTVDALDPWLAGDDPALVHRTLGNRVVVVGGGKVGLSLADLAARRGHDVTVLEPTAVFGRELGLPGRFQLVADLEDRGVNLRPEVEVRSFEHGCVVARTGDDEVERIAADSVIVATPTGPDRRVADDLEAANIAFREIGDCHRVGRLLEGALFDASELAASL
jgi:2,4-dienoyl-CoA reductase-like NADH-dependent reductase (Old Yellow Enzyme family)/ribulose 1,5-bisphosphate synthetase/thiazole synthase